MTRPVDTYKAIAAREKASRREAERLLEAKSRELFDKTHELDRSYAKTKKIAALISEIMRVAPDGIFVISPSMKVRTCNRAASKQLKLSLDNIAGVEVDRFFPGLSSALRGVRCGYFSFVDYVVRPAGTDAFVADIRGYHGPLESEETYLLFVHDASDRHRADSERRNMEQQVDEARRLEAIGALSTGVAHEINTPIQYVGDNLGYLGEALAQIQQSYVRYDALREAVADDPKYAKFIDDIDAFNKKIRLGTLITEIAAALEESHDGVKQVRDIVLLMKEFAHPGTGPDDQVDLNEIIGNVAKISKGVTKNAAEVVLELDENLKLIAGRKGQIQQVLLNLIINATDAIEEHGGANRRIRVKSESDDSCARLLISDTGGGIPDSIRKRIFDPFFTTKAVGKGTGQGLALAKDAIVNGHGGKLSLIDVDGYDTTFLIELPLADAASCNKPKPEAGNVRAA